PRSKPEALAGRAWQDQLVFAGQRYSIHVLRGSYRSMIGRSALGGRSAGAGFATSGRPQQARSALHLLELRVRDRAGPGRAASEEPIELSGVLHQRVVSFAKGGELGHDDVGDHPLEVSVA